MGATSTHQKSVFPLFVSESSSKRERDIVILKLRYTGLRDHPCNQFYTSTTGGVEGVGRT
jgi:hypothetical protein